VRFDTIVMTWTLCSIPNPIAAFTEMRRVLGPGGRLIFVEHGLSPELRVARWQHWLTPYWNRISGGCHLDRKTDDLIRAAGFQIDAVETGYMTGPKPWAFMYRGSAQYRCCVIRHHTGDNSKRCCFRAGERIAEHCKPCGVCPTSAFGQTPVAPSER
jgi:SAM-dependent methyltransferase